MYKLTDYVTNVLITGLNPVYGPDGEPEWLQAAKEANKAPRYTPYL